MSVFAPGTTHPAQLCPAATPLLRHHHRYHHHHHHHPSARAYRRTYRTDLPAYQPTTQPARQPSYPRNGARCLFFLFLAAGSTANPFQHTSPIDSRLIFLPIRILCFSQVAIRQAFSHPSHPNHRLWQARNQTAAARPQPPPPLFPGPPNMDMDPTTTEHDYRFPRRPDHHHDAGLQMQYRATNHARLDDSADSSPRATRDADIDIDFDLDGGSPAHPQSHRRRPPPGQSRTMPRDIPANAAQQQKPQHQSPPSQSSGLLGASLFPALDDVSTGSNINQMQTDDPLAAQIWKFFSKTKQQLPNQQRMENLTWRMMALNMRKRQQEESRLAYVSLSPFFLIQHLPLYVFSLIY